MTKIHKTTCSGFCKTCNTEHTLTTGGMAEVRARELMHELEDKGVIDIFSPQPHLSTQSLFGEPRGKMFGVLECDNKGERTFLYAFSGQFCSAWNIEGWAPPLFSIAQWEQTSRFNINRIERLTAHIGLCTQKAVPNTTIATLKKRRKKLSQNLMQQIHELYTVYSFAGKPGTLADAFIYPQKIPTGTGDCCAPKLLNMAHKHGLKPVSIAEFFFGRTNKSGTKEHGHFYSSCTTKCAPLLGYMLCPQHKKIC